MAHVQRVICAQAVDKQRKLEEILAAVICCDIQLRPVPLDSLPRTGDRLTLRALDIHLEISARPAVQHAVERAHLRLAALVRDVRLTACLIGEAAACFLPFPFPASVLSMILLFLLLCLKVLKIDHIRQKADFLLQNMAFFFIPAGVGILEQFEFVKDSMWQLLLICLVTTLLTFGVTAAAVRFGVWLQKKLTGKEDS